MMLLAPALLLALSVGPEIPLSTPVVDAAPLTRYAPQVASNGDGFLVAWVEEVSEIRVARVDRFGALLDERARIVSRASGVSLSIASDGQDYVVAYNCAADETSVCFSRVEADTGAVVHTGRIPNAYEAAVASNGDGYLAVYRATRGPSQQSVVLDAVALRSDGTVAGTPFRVSNAAAAPAVVSNGDDYLVVYSTYSFLRSVLIDGSGAVGASQVLAEAASNGPAAYGWSVDSDGDGFLVAWQRYAATTEVWLRPLSADGLPGDVRMLPGLTAYWPDVTWTGERYLVALTHTQPPSEEHDESNDVRGFTVTRSGDDARPVAVAAGEHIRESAPAGAFNGASTLMVWLSMHRYRAAAIEGRLLRNGQIESDSPPVIYSRNLTNQQSIAAARIGSRTVTAWSENRGPEQFQKVFVQRLDERGRPLDGEGIPAGDSSRDQIHPDLGGSALVWLETDLDLFATPVATVHLRFFDSDGQLQPPIVLGPAMPRSRVSVAAAGALHLVTWELNGNIVAMRVSPTSGPLEAEPFVIHDAPRQAVNPVVASDGFDFFLAWNDEELADACGICIPIYSLQAATVSRFGVVTGAPFEVAGAGASPAKAVWNGSEYALFWRWWGEDPGGAFAQAFDEDGHALGVPRPLPFNVWPQAAAWLGGEYLVALDHPDLPSWLSLVRLDRDFGVVGTLTVHSTYRPQNSQAALAASRDGGAVLAYVTDTREDRLSSRAVARRIAEDAFVPRRRAIR